VLKALAVAGIEADLLIGASAGAVNASLFAWNGGVDGVRKLEHIWGNLKRRDLLRVRPGRVALALAGRRSSFLDSRDGERFLRRHLGYRRIEDAPVRLAIVATDLSTGLAVALTRGDLLSAVVASSAFPGLYPPVLRDGLTLVDGGVVADIPLDMVVELGARSAIVITVPPLAPGPPPRTAIEILFRASTMGVEAHGRTTMLRPPDGLDVVEVPAKPSPITTFAVGRSGSAIHEAFHDTSEWLSSTWPR
jgi:NTE family protein